LVRLRLENLQAAAAERHGTTIDSLTLELEEARRMGLDVGQPGAAVSATMGKAKLHGLLVDKVRDVTDDTDRLTDAELEAIARGGGQQPRGPLAVAAHGRGG
jgi:hypothetical protein